MAPVINGSHDCWAAAGCCRFPLNVPLTAQEVLAVFGVGTENRSTAERLGLFLRPQSVHCVLLTASSLSVRGAGGIRVKGYISNWGPATGADWSVNKTEEFSADCFCLGLPEACVHVTWKR